MTTIDAHHHFWWEMRRAHSWPEQAGAALHRDFTPNDLAPELRAAGVDGTVLVQSLNDFEETKEYLALAQQHAFVRGVVGWVPLDNPAETEAALEILDNPEKLVGVRHLLRVDAAGWLGRPEVMQSLTLLARAGLSFDTVPINTKDYEHVFSIAAKLPDLRIVIDHLGRPPVPENGWEPWASLIKHLAAHENVAIKLSFGMDVVKQWKWSPAAARRYVDHVLATFGPQRVMAASNWPVVLLSGSYQQVWRETTAMLDGLPESDRCSVLGGTASRVYRLP